MQPSLIYSISVMVKSCSKCGTSKELCCFGLLKKSKDGYRSVCKECRKIERLEQAEVARNYYELNKIEIREKARLRAVAYRSKNREQINKNRNKAYFKYKDKIVAYQNNNKDRLLEKQRANKRKKLHEDPIFRIQHLVSTRIRLAIKKDGSISRHLDYSIAQLKQHLESLFEPWMNWKNHGKYNAKTWNEYDSATWTWQIDHIIPHSTFKYTSMKDDEFKRCWSLDNLRPLSAKLNCVEGSKRTRHKK